MRVYEFSYQMKQIVAAVILISLSGCFEGEDTENLLTQARSINPSPQSTTTGGTTSIPEGGTTNPNLIVHSANVGVPGGPWKLVEFPDTWATTCRSRYPNGHTASLWKIEPAAAKGIVLLNPNECGVNIDLRTDPGAWPNPEDRWADGRGVKVVGRLDNLEYHVTIFERKNPSVELAPANFYKGTASGFPLLLNNYFSYISGPEFDAWTGPDYNFQQFYGTEIMAPRRDAGGAVASPAAKTRSLRLYLYRVNGVAQELTYADMVDENRNNPTQPWANDADDYTKAREFTLPVYVSDKSGSQVRSLDDLEGPEVICDYAPSPKFGGSTPVALPSQTPSCHEPGASLPTFCPFTAAMEDNRVTFKLKGLVDPSENNIFRASTNPLVYRDVFKIERPECWNITQPEAQIHLKLKFRNSDGAESITHVGTLAVQIISN